MSNLNIRVDDWSKINSVFQLPKTEWNKQTESYTNCLGWKEIKSWDDFAWEDTLFWQAQDKKYSPFSKLCTQWEMTYKYTL